MTTSTRSLRRGGIAAAAVLAAAGAALAAPEPALPAVAAVQDDQLTSGPLSEIDERLPMLSQTRTKFTRIDILWNQVAPTRPANARSHQDPAYDWSRTDRIMCGLAKRGIVPMVAAFSTPVWAAIGGRDLFNGTEVNPARPNLVHYQNFMFALSKRYNGRQSPAVKDATCTARFLPRVRHWEVWNEPQIERTLSPQRGRVALKHYLKMTTRAYKQIRKGQRVRSGRRPYLGNRKPIVMAGAGAPRSSTNARGVSALTWMRVMLRSSAKFDAYSQHIYPAAAPLKKTRAFPSWSSLPQMTREIDRVKKRRGMKVYITEAGYTTGRGVRTGKGAVRTLRQQRTFLKQIYTRVKAARSKRFPVIMWFNLSDNPSWPGGLLRENGTKKPSWAAFRAQAKRTKRLPAELRR